jgi:hypothetical protein
MLSQLRTLSDTEMMYAIGAVVGVMLAALFGYLIGRAKDRPVVGLVLGAVLAVPGLVAISLMSKKEPAYY